MSTLRFHLLPLFALFLLIVSSAAAQQTFRSELVIRNNGTDVDTLRWGIETGASYGIDAPLGEYEWPPFPVSEIFSVRFINVPGRTGLGEGVKLDLRDPRSATQIDTFNIRLQSGTGGYPMRLEWPADMARNARRLVMLTLIDSTDMLTTSSRELTNPGLQQVMIIREGDAVAGVEDRSPAGAAVLEHISPNPVGRSGRSTIAYTLDRRSPVTLRIHDALGTLRATLVEKTEGPGRHELALPAGMLDAGVYFCTLVTASGTTTRSFVVGE